MIEHKKIYCLNKKCYNSRYNLALTFVNVLSASNINFKKILKASCKISIMHKVCFTFIFYHAADREPDFNRIVDANMKSSSIVAAAREAGFNDYGIRQTLLR